MKKTVGERELLRQLAFRKIRCIVVAHRQSRSITVGDELVHLPVIDLKLFLIKPVDEIPSLIVGFDESGKVEWLYWKISRKSRIRSNRPRPGAERLRQYGKALSFLAHLPDGFAGFRNAIRS